MSDSNSSNDTSKKDSQESRKAVREQFGRNAESYVTSTPHARGRSLTRLTEVIDAQPDWQVLDVATAAGHTAFAFAPRVAHVRATDITEEMLELARKQAKERGLDNVTVEYADAEDLPYDDDSFDLVTCRIAAHHLVDVSPFMAQATRVLRPGGLLAVVDNVVPEDAPGDYVNGFEKLRDPSHGRCLSMTEWREQFNIAGLQMVHQETIDKEMVFEDWAARHDVFMQSFLRAMLSEVGGEAARFLRPETRGEQTIFYLREGLLVGRVRSGSAKK